MKTRKEKRNQEIAAALSILVMSILITLFVIGCSSQKEIIYQDKNHYFYETQHTRDSIFLEKRDSVFIRQKNDTVFVEKFKTFNKYRIIEKIDTVLKIDTFKTVQNVIKTVEKKKPLNIFEAILMAAGVLVFGGVVVVILVAVVKLKRR